MGVDGDGMFDELQTKSNTTTTGLPYNQYDLFNIYDLLSSLDEQYFLQLTIEIEKKVIII
jgi:hypothetical protein